MCKCKKIWIRGKEKKSHTITLTLKWHPCLSRTISTPIHKRIHTYTPMTYTHRHIRNEKQKQQVKTTTTRAAVENTNSDSSKAHTPHATRHTHIHMHSLNSSLSLCLSSSFVWFNQAKWAASTCSAPRFDFVSKFHFRNRKLLFHHLNEQWSMWAFRLHLIYLHIIFEQRKPARRCFLDCNAILNLWKSNLLWFMSR